MIDKEILPSDIRIADEVITKWQSMLNVLGELIGVPAALIMRVSGNEIEVFVSSKTAGNPYRPGDKEHLVGSGLYCEKVITQKHGLLVPDALTDKEWENNPDVKLNMISYLGYPILWPNGDPFGSICVLDNKKNAYSRIFKSLLLHFRDSAEMHLEHLFNSHILEKKNEELTSYVEVLKKSEDALRKSEERFKYVLEGSREGIWDWDLETGEVHRNERWADILGYSFEDITFSLPQWADLVHPEDKERVWHSITDHLEGRTSEHECEYRMLTGNGDWKWILDRAQAVRRDGKPIRMAGTQTDIDDRKKTEELTLQASRLRAVAELSYGIAHNFNNLLQIVMGFATLSFDDLDAGELEVVRSNLERILAAAVKGSELVNGLQTFADVRGDSGEHESVIFDVAAVVQNAVEISKPFWMTEPERSGIKIELRMELEDGCRIKGQEGEVLEVVVNLLKNATEAMPEGGIITIKTLNASDEVVIAVEDAGTGLSEQDLSRVFQPFWSTKSVDIGKGMGLAVAHGLVTRQGGAMSVQSKQGTGTIFTIRFPSADHPDAKMEASAVITPQEHLTILAIDDESNVTTLIERICNKAGHRVLKAHSGQEALTIFKGEHVDLVICDLGMPGMTGWEVGNAVRSISQERQTAKPPFVLLTGWGGQDLEKEKILASGTDAVISKPISPGALATTIREVARKFRN